MLPPWKKSPDQPRQHIKNQRHYFAEKGLSSQSYGFSSSHVWMWELDCKENWAPKNWCFWIVVLEKTLEHPLDSKEIQSVHPKGNQSWILIGRTDVEAETPILWPPDVKSWLIWKYSDVGKDWRQEDKGTTENEMVGWHYQLDGHEFEQALGMLPSWLRGLSVCLQCRRPGYPWVGKIPWRRKWQPTPVFLPGESHGQRRRAGYSPWRRKESDMTERLHFLLFLGKPGMLQSMESFKESDTTEWLNWLT